MPAGFASFKEVPTIESSSGIVQIFAGECQGVASPAPYFSALLGADVQVFPRHALMLPLNPRFEHAVLVMTGDCVLDGERLEPRMLYYLGMTRSDIQFASEGGGRVLLIGGPPFPETILMWWNFVARSPEEIAQARADWQEQRRFGEVKAYNGPRLSAPALTRLARPNPVS
jgi:redox-sensitive bicupin YhaK (pirin superfamily)